jgi:protein-tyrosine-phosphatase
MMQAILQQALGDEYLVESAGANQEFARGGNSANEHSVLCMQDRNLDISSHKSRWIGDVPLADFSFIICVGNAEADKVRELLESERNTTVLVLDVPNPYQKGLDAYRECADFLDRKLPVLGEHIRTSA